MKPFAVFDIDGTLIRWQLYHAIADALVHLGYFKADEFLPVRQSRMIWKQRASDESFKAYENKLITSYEDMLSQLTVSQFEQAVNLVFEEYKDQVYTFTRNLIRQLKKDGYLLFAISNSQIEIVEKIANYHGFNDCLGAVYHRLGNRFTGQKTAYLTDKDKALKELVVKHEASWQKSVAVGDSASDIPMLEIVQGPIAFNPEKRLYLQAKKSGWRIVIERKNVVYSLKETDGNYLLA